MAYKYLNEDGAKRLANKAKEYSNKVKVSFGGTTYSQNNQTITIPKPTFSDITGEDLNGYAKTLKFDSSVAWSSSLTYSAVNHVIKLPTSGWGISITGSAGKVAHKLFIGSNKEYDGSANVSVSKADLGLGNVENYRQTSDYTIDRDDWNNLYFTHEGAVGLYTALDKKITRIGEDLSGVAKGYVISTAKTTHSDGQFSYTVLNGRLNTTEANVAVSFTEGTYPAFILSDGKTVLDPGTLKVGDTIYILENDIPDRWITSITVSSDLKTTTINFARLESDNRNIYAHCVQGDQNKVQKAGTADDSNHLGGKGPSDYASATSVADLERNVQINASNITANRTEIASIKSDYVKYESATKSLYRDGFGIYSGTKGSTTINQTGFQISGDTIQVYDNLNASPKRSTLESGYVEVSETAKAVGQGSVSNTMRMTSTGFLFNSVAVSMPAVTQRTTLLVASDFTAISNDTIDSWF